MENENSKLEKQELEKAAESLKNIDFTQDNYREIIEILNKIKELTKPKDIEENIESTSKEEQFIPHKEEIERPLPQENQKENHEEKEPAKDNQTVTSEQQAINQNTPIIFGTTVLPGFALMTDKGIKNFENAKVMSFDETTASYLLDNGKEKLTIPKETFETILNPVHADNTMEKSQSFKAQNGPAIVKENSVIPEFAMITQHGLQTFKDMQLLKFNEAENSYTIGNKNSTLTIQSDTFKEITAPERFKKKYAENAPEYEKLIESQYNDYFKQRDNTAYNFRHNFSVYARKECNSPLDSLNVAKEILNRMDSSEKEKTIRLLKQIKKEDETINQFLVRSYLEAVKEVPLNEEYIKQNRSEKTIARPFYDTITAKGQPIDKNSTLKVGDTIQNLAFKVNKIGGHGKEKLYENLTVISSSKEGNNVLLMDSNKSYYEVPRDTLLEGWNKQQQKEQKTEHKHQARNRIDMGWER